MDDAPRDGGRRDHLRVHRHRGRDHHQRGRERPAGGEADAGAAAALRDHYIVCGYGRVGSTVARELAHAGERLVVIDINPASLERAPATATWWSRATPPTTRRSAGPAWSGARPRDDHRLRREQRLRDPVGEGAQRAALHRRPGQPRGLGGEAPAGGREPRRLAVHDGRAPDRRAGDPAAGGGLHRCRAVARQPLVLAGGGRGGRGQPAPGRDGRRVARRRRGDAGDPPAGRGLRGEPAGVASAARGRERHRVRFHGGAVGPLRARRAA